MDIIQQYINDNHFGRVLGMHFRIIEPGLVHYFLKITDTHLSTPRATHGGVIAAMMDGVLGVAALSKTVTGQRIVSTVEFKINYLSPSLLGDELMGIGRVDSEGKRLLVCSGDIVCTNRDNMIIAKAMGTFNAYPLEKAGYSR